MYFVEADISKAKMSYKRTKLLYILESFKNSGLECAKIEDHDYATTRSGCGYFRAAIKRFGVNGVGVRDINDEIYLIRTDL